MAVLVGYRVWEVISTPGTGNYSLGTTPIDDANWGKFQLFSEEFSNNDQIYCALNDKLGNWETGIYTYISATNVLERTTILKSSNSDAAVNWAAGDKNVVSSILPNGIMLGGNNLSEVTTPATALTNIGAMPLAGGTITGATTIEASLTLDDSVATLLHILGIGNAGIELGRIDGTSSTPHVDFHSGATNVDYDSRIISTVGDGTVAGGTMEILTATLRLAQAANDIIKLAEGANSVVNLAEGAVTAALDECRVDVYGPLNCDAGANSRLVIPVGTNMWATDS